MKDQRGITLTVLVIYVVVMMIMLGAISLIVNQFYENTDSVDADTQEIIEFNKFNTYFLKEVKTKGNKIDVIQGNYILFTSGNSFSFSNNKIYYNNIAICDQVKGFAVFMGVNGEEERQDVVYVTLSFENFTKSINYKVEEIY